MREKERRPATAPRALLLQLLDGILVRKQSSPESKAPSGHIRGALGVILLTCLPPNLLISSENLSYICQAVGGAGGRGESRGI